MLFAAVAFVIKAELALTSSWFCSVEMLSAVVVMVLHSLDGMLRCQDRGGLCGLPVRDAS